MATTWAVWKWTTTWVTDGTILSPRGQSYSEAIQSTIQQSDLADGSKALILPETKSVKQSIKFFWHKQDSTFKTKIEGYINTSLYLKLVTHISGKEYTGYFTNIESELVIGTKTEQYNITAEFLQF